MLQIYSVHHVSIVCSTCIQSDKHVGIHSLPDRQEHKNSLSLEQLLIR